MNMVSLREAKSNLSALLDAIESGTQREIVIVRNGKPAARLVAMPPGPSLVRLGVAKGRFEGLYDGDADNGDVARLFGGGEA